MKKIEESRQCYYGETERTNKQIAVSNLAATHSSNADKVAIHYAHIFENSHNEIYIFDFDTLKFIQVNECARNNLGYTVEELNQLTPIDLKPEFTADSFETLIEPLRNSEKDKIIFVTKHRRKDGSFYPVEVHLQTSEIENNKIFVAIMLDTREREQSDNRFKAMVESGLSSIVVIDKEAKITLANKKTEKLFGYHRQELIGQSIEILVPERFRNKHIVYRSNFLNNPEKRPMGTGRELFGLHKDGSEISVEISLNPIKIRNDVFIVCTIVDIMQRINLYRKMVEFEKAIVIERIAQGVAHHMGTPLAAMLLRVQMLKDDLAEKGESNELLSRLDSIEKQIFYGQNLMQKLLKFVSIHADGKKPIDISAALREAVEIVNPICKKACIKIDLKLKDKIEVLADYDMLELVFVDILTNAIDAMPEGGNLKIYTKRERNDKAKIIITDTGKGIPKDILPHVFELFFTTKLEIKGSGLGLAVAKNVIQDHDGGISIESEEGKGTAVNIKIPIYISEAGHLSH